MKATPAEKKSGGQTERRRSGRAHPLKLLIVEMFSYSTVRSATIYSVKVGLVYRTIQALILSYIVGWELFHNKAYQVSDTVSSVATTKVKGQGFAPTNSTLAKNFASLTDHAYRDMFGLSEHGTYKILDTADYIIPPNEYNSIFVMTNYIRTIQSQGLCDEELSKFKATCKRDDDCPSPGTIMPSWSGIPTGRCVESSVKPGVKSCQIKAWCPAEHDNERFEDNIIRNVLNYTIFIKNDIEFKKFNKKLRNILSNVTNRYISDCSYDEDKDPLCPVFQLGYILARAETNETERFLMLLKGGVIQVEVIWNCDFDLYNRNCLPKYSFRRFDLPFHQTKTASGFNFRFADKFMTDGVERRVLYKAYGLRFIISVSGTAGRFSLVPLMLTIGAGVGLMSISVIIADCVMLYCTKEKDKFKLMKSLDMVKDNEESDDEREKKEPQPEADHKQISVVRV